MSSSATYLPRVWIGSKVSHKLLPSKIRPLSAHIKFTENCQAKCITCDYWKSRWQDDIDTERAIELINEIGALGIGSLRLTGGEPLLRRDLFQILEKADTSPFKRIIIQTNGLLIKKLHKEINDSPISDVAVSIDGINETNDAIRGIRGYFDLGIEGIKLLKNKRVAISVTFNRMSASELDTLAAIAREAGAHIEYNILSRSLYFLSNADLDPLWPEAGDVTKIVSFMRGTMKRPAYEVEYVDQYFNHALVDEPPCVLGYLQVFVLSNGDVLTGCYPLKPVGNILHDKLENILASEAYVRQCEAMMRRECPGCTCGVESSLGMKYGGSSAMFYLSRLKEFWSRGTRTGSNKSTNGKRTQSTPLVQIGATSTQTPQSQETTKR